MEISGNTVIDPAVGPGSFWDGWKTALFFVGLQSDLNISNNRFLDDWVSRKCRMAFTELTTTTATVPLGATA